MVEVRFLHCNVRTLNYSVTQLFNKKSHSFFAAALVKEYTLFELWLMNQISDTVHGDHNTVTECH